MAFAVLPFLFLCCSCWLIASHAKQPNILFLMCDSMDGRNMDPTANQYSLMNMPNLRSIAEQGTVFTRHYTNSPQCVPGRTVMFSGRRTDQQRGFNNGMGWGMASDQKTMDATCVKKYNTSTCQRFGQMQRLNYTILDAMQAIGYDVYLYGKTDVGGGINELASQSNTTANGFHSGPDLQIVTRSANIDRATKNTPTGETNDHDNNVHPEDFVIVQNCIDRMSAIAASNSTKPWFMYCSINIPHPPFDTNATWLAQVDIDNIPLPVWLPEDSFHPADAYMSISKNVWMRMTDIEINRVRATYYAMNVETDYLFGRVLAAAQSHGWNTSNTVISFVSDHGEMNMEHRQVWKNSMYEGSSRIPLFVAGPGLQTHARVRNLTQMIDILPTLLELGQSTPPAFLPGTSLMSMIVDEDHRGDGGAESALEYEYKEHPDYVTAQYHSNMGNTGSFMVRKGDWKYIQFGHYLKAYANYSVQLFNLALDPNEINDVAAANPSVVQEMEGILSNEYNYEYVDCIAKQNDFQIFEGYFWNEYNESTLMTKFEKSYHGFDAGDWQTIVEWRDEMLSATGSACVEHAQLWLRAVRREEI